METKSCIKPVNPNADDYNHLDIIIATINHSIMSQRLRCYEVIVKFDDSYRVSDYMEELCIMYESVGWHCYYFKYRTMVECVAMVLSEKPVERIAYFVDTNAELCSKPFKYFVNYNEHVDKHMAKREQEWVIKHGHTGGFKRNKFDI